MGKQKKAVFLGGCFQAEYSIRASLMANGVECYYLYETAPSTYLVNDRMVSNYDINKIIVFADNLEDSLKTIQPDVIIHRCYKNNGVMHLNAYEIAKKLNIPYGKYLMETDNRDNSYGLERFANCDFVLYAHDTDRLKELIKSDKSKKNKYFYSYGVGVNERSNKKLRNLNVASFGYPRFGSHETLDREKNLEMIMKGVKKTGLKLNVFNCSVNDWDKTKFKNDLIINDFFYLEEENNIMNKCKVVINFESIHKVEGAYSHKMFQTMGRGISTITYRKKCLEEMFGFSGENLIFFESSDEVAYWLYFLLKNHKFRQELENRCEKFMHEKYDWYKRFNEIMIRQGIWEK